MSPSRALSNSILPSSLSTIDDNIFASPSRTLTPRINNNNKLIDEELEKQKILTDEMNQLKLKQIQLENNKNSLNRSLSDIRKAREIIEMRNIEGILSEQQQNLNLESNISRQMQENYLLLKNNIEKGQKEIELLEDSIRLEETKFENDKINLNREKEELERLKRSQKLEQEKIEYERKILNQERLERDQLKKLEEEKKILKLQLDKDILERELVESQKRNTRDRLSPFPNVVNQIENNIIDRTINRSMDRLENDIINRSISRSINQFENNISSRPISRDIINNSIGKSISQLENNLTTRPISRAINQSINQITNNSNTAQLDMDIRNRSLLENTAIPPPINQISQRLLGTSLLNNNLSQSILNNQSSTRSSTYNLFIDINTLEQSVITGLINVPLNSKDGDLLNISTNVGNVLYYIDKMNPSNVIFIPTFRTQKGLFLPPQAFSKIVEKGVDYYTNSIADYVLIPRGLLINLENVDESVVEVNNWVVSDGRIGISIKPTASGTSQIKTDNTTITFANRHFEPLY
jgi:hypothetical protein